MMTIDELFSLQITMLSHQLHDRLYDDVRSLGSEPEHDEGKRVNDPGTDLDDHDAAAIVPAQQIQVSTPILAQPMPIQIKYLQAPRHGRSVDFLQSLQQPRSRAVAVKLAATVPVNDAPQRYRNEFAFTISVKAALRDRRYETTSVIMAELKVQEAAQCYLKVLYVLQ